MVVDSLSGGERDAATRSRLSAAGYAVPAVAELQIIHCDKGRFGWLANGFSQVIAEVEGKKCRILDYAPSQSLQLHFHNADELFVIGGGRVRCFKWADMAALNGGEAPSECDWLGPGDKLEIPAGKPHALFADPETGVQFHELVGDFGTRTTNFVKGNAENGGCYVLGADGEMRFVPQPVVDRFGGKLVLITGCSRGLGLGLVRHFSATGATWSPPAASRPVRPRWSWPWPSPRRARACCRATSARRSRWLRWLLRSRRSTARAPAWICW